MSLKVLQTLIFMGKLAALIEKVQSKLPPELEHLKPGLQAQRNLLQDEIKRSHASLSVDSQPQFPGVSQNETSQSQSDQ